MIYIATTTINYPTKALKIFAKNNNCKLIVALDKKSKKFKLKNSIILSTKYQQEKWPRLSKLVGWNCIQRRNFAILEAYERGAKKIALIDDDNIPYSNWFNNINLNKKIFANEVKTNQEVFDPIGFTNHKLLWHRGYPLEMVKNRKYKLIEKKNKYFDVIAGFWNGDPDIDAICRMLYKPNCLFKKKYFPFFSKKISPFNSQNTILNRKSIKNYFLFPHIGRMDDIWASFYLQSKGFSVCYIEPTVFQKRNKHNLIKDFNHEIIGYSNSLNLISSLKKNPESIHKFLPKKSSLAFKEWKKIIRKIDKKKYK